MKKLKSIVNTRVWASNTECLITIFQHIFRKYRILEISKISPDHTHHQSTRLFFAFVRELWAPSSSASIIISVRQPTTSPTNTNTCARHGHSQEIGSSHTQLRWHLLECTCTYFPSNDQRLCTTWSDLTTFPTFALFFPVTDG